MRASRVALAVLLAGCTVDALDLEGRQCPCIDGWDCDETRNVCVRAGEAPDAGAGRDAGPGVDSGPGMDAGDVDAGPGDLDAGGVDAGPGMDAGGVDAGTDAGGAPPSLCDSTHSGREFCDGFDSGDLSAWTFSNINGSGSITPVTSPVYRGSHAMRYFSPMGSVFSYTQRNVYSSRQPTDVWHRAYYYLESAHPPNLEFHAIADTSFRQEVIAALWDTSTGNWHAHTYMGDVNHDFAYEVPLDRWFCVEMHLHVDETAGGVEVFIDDTLVQRDLSVSSLPDDGNVVGTAVIGVRFKESTTADQVIYVDEVVVDESRIGCDP